MNISNNIIFTCFIKSMLASYNRPSNEIQAGGQNQLLRQCDNYQRPINCNPENMTVLRDEYIQPPILLSTRQPQLLRLANPYHTLNNSTGHVVSSLFLRDSQETLQSENTLEQGTTHRQPSSINRGFEMNTAHNYVIYHPIQTDLYRRGTTSSNPSTDSVQSSLSYLSLNHNIDDYEQNPPNLDNFQGSTNHNELNNSEHSIINGSIMSSSDEIFLQSPENSNFLNSSSSQHLSSHTTVEIEQPFSIIPDNVDQNTSYSLNQQFPTSTATHQPPISYYNQCPQSSRNQANEPAPFHLRNSQQPTCNYHCDGGRNSDELHSLPISPIEESSRNTSIIDMNNQRHSYDQREFINARLENEICTTNNNNRCEINRFPQRPNTLTATYPSNIDNFNQIPRISSYERRQAASSHSNTSTRPFSNANVEQQQMNSTNSQHQPIRFPIRSDLPLLNNYNQYNEDEANHERLPVNFLLGNNQAYLRLNDQISQFIHASHPNHQNISQQQAKISPIIFNPTQNFMFGDYNFKTNRSQSPHSPKKDLNNFLFTDLPQYHKSFTNPYPHAKNNLPIDNKNNKRYLSANSLVNNTADRSFFNIFNSGEQNISIPFQVQIDAWQGAQKALGALICVLRDHPNYMTDPIIQYTYKKFEKNNSTFQQIDNIQNLKIYEISKILFYLEYFLTRKCFDLSSSHYCQLDESRTWNQRIKNLLGAYYEFHDIVVNNKIPFINFEPEETTILLRNLVSETAAL